MKNWHVSPTLDIYSMYCQQKVSPHQHGPIWLQGGVGACVAAVLLKNSTPSSNISFQQQIFITGMHLGVLHPRGLPVCFRLQKHQEWEGEEKKKKTGQSFESVSDRLGQLSVYINKLEF